MIIDDFIDDSSIRIWTCFTDKTIRELLDSLKQFKSLNEAEAALDGKAWRKLPFWGKVRDYVVSGVNSDGSRKGWFEDRKFPTKVVKASDFTAEQGAKILKDGFNVKIDYSGATPEQAKRASSIAYKLFDREFLIAHSQAAQDASDVAGTAGAVAGGVVGGTPGAAVGGTAAKGFVLDKSDEIVDRFNETVKGTEYDALTITDADKNMSWFDIFIQFVYSHRYVSTATVIALVIALKNRKWIWDRLKLGFNNLWQGKIIAKYYFDLVDGKQLSFEYDLRFNRWRLLYRKFKWSGDAYPSREMVASFVKTRHCRQFIGVCEKHMANWFKNESLLRDVASTIEGSKYKDAAKMILAVLDDKEDIMRSFVQLEYKVG